MVLGWQVTSIRCQACLSLFSTHCYCFCYEKTASFPNSQVAGVPTTLKEVGLCLHRLIWRDFAVTVAGTLTGLVS